MWAVIAREQDLPLANSDYSKQAVRILNTVGERLALTGRVQTIQ